jgi:sec-independent protein translocase protein TatB
MFDFDVGKLFIIGVVALVVIGPKELPRVLRQVGQAIGKMRRISADFQKQFMDAMHEADLADLKAEAEKLSKAARIDVTYDPVREIKSHMTEALHAADGVIPPESRAAIPLEGPMQGPRIESHLEEGLVEGTEIPKKSPAAP